MLSSASASRSGKTNLFLLDLWDRGCKRSFVAESGVYVAGAVEPYLTLRLTAGELQVFTDIKVPYWKASRYFTDGFISVCLPQYASVQLSR